MTRELQYILLLFCLIEVSDTTVSSDCESEIRKTNCPDFDKTSWRNITKRCCGNNGTFHCQEPKSGPIVVTCQDSHDCEKGNFAKLTQVTSENVTIECLPCENGYFEPSRQESFQFRRPWCRNSIQLCQGKGKILVFAGNASHDGLCTCNWKEGWSSSSSQCLDPSGFPANSPCSCEERSCPDGFRLNSSFKCSPPLESDTTLMKSSERFTEMKTTPFSGFDLLPTTTVSDWNRDDGDLHRNATIISIVAFAVLAVIGAVIYYRVCAKPEQHPNNENEGSMSLITSDDQSEDSVHMENEDAKIPLNTSDDQSRDSVHMENEDTKIPLNTSDDQSGDSVHMENEDTKIPLNTSDSSRYSVHVENEDTKILLNISDDQNGNNVALELRE